jgi:hypothetical protein
VPSGQEDRQELETRISPGAQEVQRVLEIAQVRQVLLPKGLSVISGGGAKGKREKYIECNW